MEIQFLRPWASHHSAVAPAMECCVSSVPSSRAPDVSSAVRLLNPQCLKETEGRTLQIDFVISCGTATALLLPTSAHDEVYLVAELGPEWGSEQPSTNLSLV